MRILEGELNPLRELSRRHIDCESIHDAHANCETTIDSLRQQIEEGEETNAALRIDVQRLVLENNHSDGRYDKSEF